MTTNVPKGAGRGRATARRQKAAQRTPLPGDPYWCIEAADVTPEILQLAGDIVEGWYNDGPIDWEDIWDRMEDSVLSDSTKLRLSNSLDTPAMRKIQSYIREERRS